MKKDKKKNEIREATTSYLKTSNPILNQDWEVFNSVQKKSDPSDLSKYLQKAKEVGITKKMYSELLGVNLRTLNRYLDSKSQLDSDKTEKAYRLNRLFTNGISVLGSSSLFSMWLFEKNSYLNDKPINFIKIISGIEIVENLLGKIDYGVFG